MGLSNIVLTIAPLAVGMGIFGLYLWGRKGTFTSKRPRKEECANDQDEETEGPPPNIHEPSTDPRSPTSSQTHTVNHNTEFKAFKPGSSQTVMYDRNVNNLGPPNSQNVSQSNDPVDLETDAPLSSLDNASNHRLSMDADVIPSTRDSLPLCSETVPISNCGYPEMPVETHDALILYAEKDGLLAQRLQKDLVASVNLPNLNVILYEEFAPEVQSHFGTMTILFQRCRYLLVLVTRNFTEASFSRFQHEIALKDSIENPSKNERVIPIWGDIGAKDIVSELSVFKGIDYSVLLQGDDRSRVFNQFKKVFEYGRKKIKMS